MNQIVKRTAVGGGLGAAAFGVVSAYQATSAGVLLADLLGPVVFMMVLGGTIGGLAGPLLGEGIARSLRRRARARDG